MTSTKTGIALYKSIGLIVVGNPAATVMTSSPGLMAFEPSLGEVRLAKAIKLAEDPEFTVIKERVFKNFDNSFSNSKLNRPVVK